MPAAALLVIATIQRIIYYGAALCALHILAQAQITAMQALMGTAVRQAAAALPVLEILTAMIHALMPV
jgi:uncharacterized membrane protein